MKADLSLASKGTVGKRIAANAGLMVGSKILAVFLGLGSLAIATKSLSAYEFGSLVFLHAYMLFFSEVATFQTWQPIIRYGTDDLKSQDCTRLGQLLNFGIKLDALSAVLAYILSVAVFGFVAYLAPGGNAAEVSELQGYAALYCILLLIRQRGASIGVFRLFDQFNVLAIKSVLMPVIRFIGVVIAVMTDAGFEGFLLAWFMGSALSYIYLPTMAILELKRRRLLIPAFKAKINFFSPRAGLWPFVIKSNIDSTLAAANLHLPMLLVTMVFGPIWAGIFKIAEEVSKLLSEGFKLLDQVIYPELAKMVAAGQTDKIWRLVRRAAIILLSFGLTMSVAFLFIGPFVLSVLTSDDFTPAVPLASLLVPAAALLGTAAPLYPIFYAADRPMLSVYARGAGVLVYIASFFVLSVTIGQMAPGWAAILGNATAVVLVVTMAKRTLNNIISRDKNAERVVEENMPVSSVRPYVEFIDETDKKIWSLSIHEWQARAFKKAGATSEKPEVLNPSHLIVMDVRWVLSSALATAFVSQSGIALVAGDVIIGTHGVDTATAKRVIGSQPEDHDFAALGLLLRTPDELAGNYNKALRKSEAPYALNVETADVVTIMKRQYASSYKGITDFVTKWVWPIPAFYVTRVCAALRLTPNMVTTIGFVLMLVALYSFWQGQWMIGFVSGWLMTFLDTVDGKLARTTMTYSWWGNIYDHGIDLIHPPFWYFAWFVGLGGVWAWPDVTSDMMSVAIAAICVGYVVDRIIEGLFLQRHGFHIHVWTKFNSALRFFIARRNPNMFIFMVGIALIPWIPQAGIWGFYAVAIWTWVCIAINVISLLLGYVVRRPLSSWMDPKPEPNIGSESS